MKDELLWMGSYWHETKSEPSRQEPDAARVWAYHELENQIKLSDDPQSMLRAFRYYVLTEFQLFSEPYFRRYLCTFPIRSLPAPVNIEAPFCYMT